MQNRFLVTALGAIAALVLTMVPAAPGQAADVPREAPETAVSGAELALPADRAASPDAAAVPALKGPMVKRAQRKLRRLNCSPGPVDGSVGDHTRAAVIRFQSRHFMKQTGRLTNVTRKKLYSRSAKRCDRRPVPRGSGHGRRVVVSQKQNWVWLVRRNGRVLAQGGMIDNPGEIGPGAYRTGSYCGRASRISRNSDYGGDLWLNNFVRWAPCGFGFHRIPIYKGSGRQIHANWLLGTNLRTSSGCIRLSASMSRKLWDFTSRTTPVRLV